MINEKDLKLLKDINNTINREVVKDPDFEISDIIDDIAAIHNLSRPEAIDHVGRLMVAIMAFTGESVDTVRNPFMFDPAKSSELYLMTSLNNEEFLKNFYLGAYRSEVDMMLGRKMRNFSQKDYSESNYIFSKFSKTKSTDDNVVDISILYRGIFDLTFNTLNAWVRPGSVFDLGNIVSTTIDPSTAKFYATKDTKPIAVFLKILNPNKIGFYVRGLSSFPNEEEVTLSGNVRTLSVEGNITVKNKSGSLSVTKTKDYTKILKFQKALLEKKAISKNDFEIVYITCELI